MKKILLSLFLTAALLSSNLVAFAEPIFDGYYDYEGAIGKSKILMSLYFQEDSQDVKGSYLYDQYRTVIQLVGKKKGNSVSLTEYDSKKKIVATFVGQLNKDDSYTGYWKNAKTGKKTDFKVSLFSALPFADYNHRYALLNIEEDKIVEAYAVNLQKMVIKNDKVGISKLIAYPLSVYSDGELLTFENEKDFIANYDKAMTPALKKALSTAYTQYMFANGEGLMFGANNLNVWIGSFTDPEGHLQLKIFSFNI